MNEKGNIQRTSRKEETHLWRERRAVVQSIAGRDLQPCLPLRSRCPRPLSFQPATVRPGQDENGHGEMSRLPCTPSHFLPSACLAPQEIRGREREKDMCLSWPQPSQHTPRAEVEMLCSCEDFRWLHIRLYVFPCLLHYRCPCPLPRPFTSCYAVRTWVLNKPINIGFFLVLINFSAQLFSFPISERSERA